MKHQTLNTKKRQLVIETPSGFITIKQIGRWMLELDMPDDTVAHISMDRAQRSAKYVDPEGKPKFHTLTPKVDESGKLVGVSTPPTFRLARSG